MDDHWARAASQQSGAQLQAELWAAIEEHERQEHILDVRFFLNRAPVPVINAITAELFADSMSNGSYTVNGFEVQQLGCTPPILRVTGHIRRLALGIYLRDTVFHMDFNMACNERFQKNHGLPKLEQAFIRKRFGQMRQMTPRVESNKIRRLVVTVNNVEKARIHSINDLAWIIGRHLNRFHVVTSEDELDLFRERQFDKVSGCKQHEPEQGEGSFLCFRCPAVIPRLRERPLLQPAPSNEVLEFIHALAAFSHSTTLTSHDDLHEALFSFIYERVKEYSTVRRADAHFDWHLWMAWGLDAIDLDKEELVIQAWTDLRTAQKYGRLYIDRRT